MVHNYRMDGMIWPCSLVNRQRVQTVLLVATSFLLVVRCLDVASRGQEFVGADLDGGSHLPKRAFVNVQSTPNTKVYLSHGFSVEYHNTYKLVRVNATGEVYCLCQCGTQAPSLSKLPVGAKLFSIPLSALSVVDTTVVAFMAELGVLDRIRYVTKSAVEPCMQTLAMPTAAAGCGLRAELPSGDASIDAANRALTQQRAEVAAIWTGAGAGDISSKSISFLAAAEATPLAQAEWLKYAAAFFNLEVEASARFGAIAASYAATRDAAVLAAGPRRPLVAWASAPLPSSGGLVSISLEAFHKHLIQDAGGSALTLPSIQAAGGEHVQCMGPTTPFPGPCTAASTAAMVNTSTPAGASALLRILQEVEVLIDETPLNSTATTLSDVITAYGLAPTSSPLPPFLASQRVYRLDAHARAPSGPSDVVTLDWMETAVARPDLGLQDFVAAIHPPSAASAAATAPSGPRRAPAFLRNVARQAVVVVGPQRCTALHACCALQPGALCPHIRRDCATGELQYPTANTRCGPTCTPTATAVASLPAPPAAAPSSSSSSSSSSTPDNGASALRPLLLVFLLIIALIEGLIHCF